LGFKLDRALVGRTGVESGAVIKGLDVVASLGKSGETLVVDYFVFKAAPEGLDEGVIVAIAFATHGSDEVVLGQDLPISGAGKLHLAIGVDDKGGFGTALQGVPCAGQR
jgi:hypothetical protein